MQVMNAVQVKKIIKDKKMKKIQSPNQKILNYKSKT